MLMLRDEYRYNLFIKTCQHTEHDSCFLRFVIKLKCVKLSLLSKNYINLSKLRESF